jgi:hypothetical protein
MEITMVMSGDHLLMIEHIISMEYIVISFTGTTITLAGLLQSGQQLIEFHLDFQQQI